LRRSRTDCIGEADPYDESGGSVGAMVEAPTGIDVPAVSAWLTEHVHGAVGPFTFELVAGGRSNLTFRVADAAGHEWALRRPPVSHVLPTAHDMVREHTVLSAVGPAGIPVPRTVALCTDETVNERPFYVMAFVNGHILRDANQARAELPVDARGRVGTALATTLARLHALDPDEIGLGDLARHDGYVERQLRRWQGQYDQMQVEGVDQGDVVAEVGERLARSVPEQQRVSVVHGDYRLDNTVLSDDGSLLAVLDWEICTLGDPLADVGLLCDYWADAGDPQVALVGQAPTTAPGFETREQVLKAYEAASGIDCSQIAYYRAFGYWKLACILQGVYARYVAGATAGDTGSVDSFPAHVVALAESARSLLDTLS
jgi:aminoglycoside phosphotransferase (APT) family kinase protein